MVADLDPELDEISRSDSKRDRIEVELETQRFLVHHRWLRDPVFGTQSVRLWGGRRGPLCGPHGPIGVGLDGPIGVGEQIRPSTDVKIDRLRDPVLERHDVVRVVLCVAEIGIDRGRAFAVATAGVVVVALIVGTGGVAVSSDTATGVGETSHTDDSTQMS